MRYIPIEMSDKQIIINYMRDRREDPKYQSCPRRIFKEICWCHWIQDEIIKKMQTKPDRTAKQILKTLQRQMKICLDCSKTYRSKELFRTALTEVNDCLDLLRAKEE